MSHQVCRGRLSSAGVRGSALAFFLIFAVPAFAQTTIRFSSSAPPSDFLAKSLVTFKDAVESATAGAVKVDTYPANALFRQGTEILAIQRGTLEMSTGTTFEVAEQIPQLGLFNRAYLFRDYAQLRRILAVAYLGTRQLALRSARTVSTPADLSGVKLRMTAGPEWQLLGRALGASPVPMGMPEVYLALQTGTIDGEDNPLSIVNAAKLFEVTKTIVLTAHMLQPVFFDIGEQAWKKLTPEQQAAVQAAAITAQKQNDAARLADEEGALGSLKAKGLTIQTPDLAAFRAYADKVYADAARGWDQDLLKTVLAAP
jgi:TRAP-type C4-dicarboxylate transport system substrate-binding protein